MQNNDQGAEPPASPGAPDPLLTVTLKPHVIDALSHVFDPEIPVNIYELGLIYDIVIDSAASVHVRMTLTSPACPSAQQLPAEVRDRARAVDGVTDATVEVVWDPPWSPDRMSEAARLQLGLV
jgi:FeS assembly SUF system protein